MDLNLTGKNAIVCGSTQGLGLASAIELALLGANITLMARDENKLKDAVKNLASAEWTTTRLYCCRFPIP